jgi:superfamily II DNA or RNA helicase
LEEFPKVDWRVISKETFRRDWHMLSKYDAIVIDEVHHFSSIKSQLHKFLLKYIKKHSVEYIWGLTATPYRREPLNIYALAKIHGHEWNFLKFRMLFYREQYFGSRSVWLPKKGIEKEVAKLVSKIGDVVSFDECSDLPEITHKVVNITMTEEQKKAIEEVSLNEPNNLTLAIREHQICSGIGVKTNKTDYIIGILDTTPKMAIFCRFLAEIEHYKNILREYDIPVYIINGATNNKNQVAKSVEAVEKCVVLIQSDSAEGFELPSINVVVFSSMSYSYLSYTQSLGRFIRINKKNNPKLFIYLLTDDSIDESVYENLLKKKDFDIAIYAKKRTKISN